MDGRTKKTNIKTKKGITPIQLEITETHEVSRAELTILVVEECVAIIKS
jgi:hypothetical protein